VVRNPSFAATSTKVPKPGAFNSGLILKIVSWKYVKDMAKAELYTV